MCCYLDFYYVLGCRYYVIYVSLHFFRQYIVSFSTGVISIVYSFCYAFYHIFIVFVYFVFH